MRKSTLRLELGLDHVEGAGDDARGEATDGSGHGVELRVGSRSRPFLQRRGRTGRVHCCVGGGGGEAVRRHIIWGWRPAWLRLLVVRHPLPSERGFVESRARRVDVEALVGLT